MRRLTGTLLAAGVLLALVCGCGAREDIEADPGPQLPENVVYVDSDLLRQVECEHVSCERLASGRRRITARFHNTLDRTAECQIKLRFTDAAGHVVDETNWTPLLLPRRQTTQFTQASLTTRAEGFTVLLREARTK
jgi:hypothetical protein